jgi:hypothetical protein
MRNDMRKVLIERPRAGSSRCYHEVRQRNNRVTDLDDLPSCEGMRRPYNWDERKEFSDLLGPLRKFLWSCRGRRWDDVYSEICAQLSNNTVDSHLKHIHVPQFIETDVRLRDGKLFTYGRYTRGEHEVSGLYVHPISGLVCNAEASPRPKGDPRVRVDDIPYRKGADGVLRPITGNWINRKHPHYSRKIIGFEREAIWAGVWYWVIFDSVPDVFRQLSATGYRLVHPERIDLVTGKTVKSGGRYRADKRQMSARDMRRHGLVNE